MTTQDSRMRDSIEKIIAAHGKTAEFEQAEEFHLRIENPPFLPLSIERHGRTATVTHYYEQNGDLVPDPDMEFEITPDGRWLPVAIQFATGAYKRAITFDEDGRKLVNPRELRDQIEFSNMWARNLIAQGFARKR